MPSARETAHRTMMFILPILLFFAIAGETSLAAPYQKQDTWLDTVLATREALKDITLDNKARGKTRDDIQQQLRRDFPFQWDWSLQDSGNAFQDWFFNADPKNLEIKMLEKVSAECRPDDKMTAAMAAAVKAGSRERLGLYEKLCHSRRRQRLRTLLDRKMAIVFTKHHNLGGSHYAYTEAQSDAQAERHFMPNGKLCLITMDSLFGTLKTLVDDPKGMIRDPDVSYDGRKILFAWKKSDRQDDFHLYDMEVETGKIRQLTFGLGYADYEAAYLPDGDIVFNSSRCVQIVDCWWTEVSNLYTCDANGLYLRRLSFDQVHTNFPAVLDNGKVIYTRWDYNDRGQLYPQPLYQMNPDGTAQAECYGNNSWFPTTILHARGVPGTNKIIAIATGHHTKQAGKLLLVDPDKGSQENSGATLIAPVRPTDAPRIDRYGQGGELFQYPYALNEEEYLVTYAPFGWHRPGLFNIYYMTKDGRRELLAADPHISCNQTVPLAPRPVPHQNPNRVNHKKAEGIFYVQDVYAGQGLKGIPRGTVKKLRVVEIRFRAAGVGSNRNGGPAGGALVSTPISIDNGAWDVKAVLGDADVYADGSACFKVPAHTPVYFQALDERGFAVQSMRTWSTLQPGENLSCVGCHEKKNETPLSMHKTTLAMRAGPQALETFYGPARGFSFAREVQPILDKHCIRCHHDRSKQYKGGAAKHPIPEKTQPAFSLLDTRNPEKRSGRAWTDSYLMLTQRGKPDRGPVKWLNVQSIPPLLPPYFAGAEKSPIMKMLAQGHGGVKLSREATEKLASWIDLLVPFSGDYIEGHAWNEGQLKKYLHFLAKRDRMTAVIDKNISLMLTPGEAAPAGEASLTFTTALNPYRNLALNPKANQGYARTYPHASSNSEYRDMPAFAARNAINGKTDNRGHGNRFPSWGPDKEKGLWWKVDFGRMVTVDKVVLYIRADFPHDDAWQSATIQFSDGSSEAIKIKKTAEAQTFTFAKRNIMWLRFQDLVEEAPLGWCGFTEVEAWGQDLYAPPVLTASND